MADPKCQSAYEEALKAAQEAADALDIDHEDSPLVKELELRETQIPDASEQRPIKEAFIETMKDVKAAADAVKAAAS